MTMLNVVYFAVAVLIVGALLFAIMTFTKGGEKQLDVEKYRSRWLAIEQRLNRDDSATYQIAILHADKLLGFALKEKGLPGQTMGEKMKQVTWTRPNEVWSAHKVRNRIAHEPDVEVSFSDTKRALAGLKQGLKDVGAI